MSPEALAALIAAHPVIVFAALLAILLALGAVVLFGARRVAVRGWPLLEPLWRASPALRLLTLLAGGLGVTLLALTAFFEIADETEADESLGRFDDALAAALHARVSTPVLQGFAWITRLGDPAWITLLCAGVAGVLLWQKRRLLAIAWVAAVAGNGALTRLLKALFERARPLHEHGWIAESGWGFPSGHASAAMAAYGMLAYVVLREARAAWRWLAAPAAATLILLVGYSRIVLQVHYFSDVLAGLTVAAAWIAVCIVVVELLYPVRAGARR